MISSSFTFSVYVVSVLFAVIVIRRETVIPAPIVMDL